MTRTKGIYSKDKSKTEFKIAAKIKTASQGLLGFMGCKVELLQYQYSIVLVSTLVFKSYGQMPVHIRIKL